MAKVRCNSPPLAHRGALPPVNERGPNEHLESIHAASMKTAEAGVILEPTLASSVVCRVG